MGPRNILSPPRFIDEDWKNEITVLQCPFTWGMGDINKSVEYQYSPNDDEELFPLLKLMRNIMAIYVKANDEESYEDIVDNLKICEKMMGTLKNMEDPNISIRVVSHILEATKYYAFRMNKMLSKAAEILSKISSLEDMSKKEKSTLYACRSICWSKYHRVGAHEAEKFIKLAIEENPNSDLFKFILAKNLRRQRRDITINSKPGEKEVSNFHQAYVMSQNPVYGIFLAQMYREQRDYPLAIGMYDKIYNSNPESNTIRLRLALGFIHYKQFNKAKDCLDQVAKECPNLSMYLHYQGLYYLKRHEYKKALPYYEKAIEVENLPAEKQYLTCMLKTEKSFDLLKYLLHMVERYKDFPKEQIQSLYLDVAFTYWKKHDSFDNALLYFLKAIQVNPSARCLTSYFFNANVIPIKYKNIYCILTSDFLPKITAQFKYDDFVMGKVLELNDYCKSYFTKQRAMKEKE